VVGSGPAVRRPGWSATAAASAQRSARPGRTAAGVGVARAAQSKAKVEVDDHYLLALAKQGSSDAFDKLVKRYHSFVRLKASSYFLVGGDSEDLIQEGLVGLYKAIRDFRSDRESSFRNFAELCITRQIITAVKTATRNKHTPLNGYVSFSSSPAGSSGDGEPTLDEILPGSPIWDPANQAVSTEELRSLVACLSTVLSELESRVLSLYLDGHSYVDIGEQLGCDCKTVDNALQRVKRKVGAHLREREVLL
jgi:RNA polymerase sporulation-specific sigma factor